MAIRKLHCGVGAKYNVKPKYMHPGKLIDDKYPNSTAHHVMEGLVAIRVETKKVCHKDQRVFVGSENV